MLSSFEEDLENINGFETDFVKILTYNLSPGYSDTYQSYNYNRFCTIIEGHKELTINHESFRYDKSKSLFLQPHTKVYMDISIPTKAIVFEFSNTLITNVLDKTKGTINESKLLDSESLLISKLNIDIGDTIFNLIKSSPAPKNLDPFIVDLHAQKLIYDLLKAPETGKRLMNQSFNPMDKAINYMKQNLNQPFSGKELAEIMNMSPSNLSHSFKNHTGVSPVKYMHALKMKRAKELLNRMTVTDTAFELAYETPSYFIHMFKNYYGCTPKKFQQNHLL